MASIALSDVSSILEVIIRPAVEDQLYKKTLALQMFQKNSGITQMFRDQFLVPIRTGRQSGVVAITEGNSLVSGKPVLNQATVSAKWETASFQITKQTLAVRERGSVVNILKEYGELLERDVRQDINRQLFSDGTGSITTTANSGTTTATTVTLTASTNGDIDFTQYFAAGMPILLGSTTLATISSVTNGGTIQLTAGKSWASGAVITKADGSGAAAPEMTGLPKLILDTSGTVQGIASGPGWTAGLVDTTAGQLSEGDMHKAFFAANRTGDVKYIVMNKTLFTRYGNIVTAYKRSADTKEVLSGGWKGLDYMGGNATVVLDYDCNDDKVYFITPSAFTVGELSPFQFEKGTDGTLLRLSGQLAYEVAASWFLNIGVFNRGANAALTGRTG